MLFIVFIVALQIFFTVGIEFNKDSNVQYIVPTIGTADQHGGMIPSTARPFAMTRWTAMTQENHVGQCPYYNTGTTFYGFLGTHQPAVWMGESGEVAVSFGVGDVKPAFKDRGLSFTHDDEFSSASYYSIKLTTPDKQQIFAELSGASRAGIMRVTFPEGSSPYVSLQATRAGFKGQVKIDPLRREISGYNPERQDSVLGPDKAPSFKGYFVVRFQERFDSYGTALDSDLTYQSTSAEGEIVSAFVTFPKNTQKVHFKVGVSFISIDQARRNIDLEIPDGKSLEQVSDETASKWAEKVDLVKLYGASEDQKKVFYTAMFHAFQYPYEMFEHTPSGNAYYSGYDDKIHPGIAYTGYSIWDTFRAEWGFLNLFAPERINDMITSMLQSYKQSGRLPMWQNIVETNIMIGTHSSSLIAESLAKGFKDFDLELAWEAIYKDAMVPPVNDTTTLYFDRQEGTDYEARAGLTTYMANGWVAAMKTSEAASRTLEYAYDDYTVGVAAQHTGHADQADFFFQRMKNYRSLWNNQTQFMEARNEDGSWNPSPSTWTEADEWIYTFNVQHDFAGLRDLFGGAESMKAKLDAYFAGNHNQQTNEPSHATPFAYHYGNAPESVQKEVRHILTTDYTTGPYGLSGDDDCGQMSSWYIFNSFGFYPVNPASATYIVSAPLFDKVEIKFPHTNRVLTITSQGAGDNIYVEKLSIDGKDVVAPVITHQQLMSAKDITFTMNKEPQTWFKGQV